MISIDAGQGIWIAAMRLNEAFTAKGWLQQSTFAASI
jgi:hypothetical protein